ncbi:MAG: TetR/AcrR family transcriptional regulator [Nevskia sp.]|nr:TetR/AcrR family transcriptional regulator [Nevskia sp.]
MRRRPTQERSRQVVEALIEATAQSIAQRGLAQTTTNHIAARAGVSVGSVYQYFRNKEELVGALLDKLVADLGHAVDRGLPLLLDADLRTIVRGLLQAGFAFIGGNEKLYLELARNWDQLSTQRFLRTLERHLQEVFRLYALRHYRELHIEDLPVAVFVVTHSMVFTILQYLSLPQAPCTREKLMGELTEMAAGYLERGASAQQRSPSS